jgi:uncharacterized metal-binding protein
MTDIGSSDISTALEKDINDARMSTYGCVTKSATDIISSDIIAALEKNTVLMLHCINHISSDISATLKKKISNMKAFVMAANMVSSDISGRKISTVDVCPPSAVHQISLLNHQHLY